MANEDKILDAFKDVQDEQKTIDASKKLRVGC